MPTLADRDNILLKDTCLQNSFICQPQQRNIHGRIFGGFLMRRAFELAFSTAYAFVGVAPQFLEVDHVDFVKPVDVGNFLRLKSCVLYTELDNPDKPLVNVEVVAHVTKPELRSSEVSNRFYFTFGVDPEAIKNGLSIRSVVPDTEEEARKVDLSGGYYDAGDNVKFGWTVSFSMSLLSWSAIEFRAQLRSAKELGHVLDAIRWGSDFILKSHTSPTTLYTQVGDGNGDHQCWERPEDMDTARIVYKIDANSPGTEAAADAAAALASASIVFKKADPKYSSILLAKSKSALQHRF